MAYVHPVCEQQAIFTSTHDTEVLRRISWLSDLQAILDFCNQPGFVHEVFMNLDCRIERSNLFEAICTLLSKAAFPVSSSLGSVHLLSLEGIYSILAALASRWTLLSGPHACPCALL